MVDPESKQAKSLNYVEDASTLDPAVVTKYKPGSMCSNCQLYAGGDDHGGCAIFAGKNVKATGWCNVYAAKAG